MLLLKKQSELAHWDPEVDETWDKKFAWQTLWITTYNLTLAFAVWFLVSAIAPRLNDIGYSLTDPQLYWLVAIPGLAGGLCRLIYMFLPSVVGTPETTPPAESVRPGGKLPANTL